MEISKRGNIPMQEKPNLSKAQGASTPKEVKRMQRFPYVLTIGLIICVVRCTRHDVDFAQNLCSRFQQNPGKLHWPIVKTILKYSRNTKDMVLVYGGDLGRAIEWTSAKQSIIAMSSIEAEYIAASEDVKEVFWMRKFTGGVGSVVPTKKEHM
ncbi:hypothetical protein Tco_0132203 [Tanacetum coccineum]